MSVETAIHHTFKPPDHLAQPDASHSAISAVPTRSGRKRRTAQILSLSAAIAPSPPRLVYTTVRRLLERSFRESFPTNRKSGIEVHARSTGLGELLTLVTGVRVNLLHTRQCAPDASAEDKGTTQRMRARSTLTSLLNCTAAPLWS